LKVKGNDFYHGEVATESELFAPPRGSAGLEGVTVQAVDELPEPSLLTEGLWWSKSVTVQFPEEDLQVA